MYDGNYLIQLYTCAEFCVRPHENSTQSYGWKEHFSINILIFPIKKKTFKKELYSQF